MLLNRYEVESCSDRVTHYGIRTVTGSAHKLSDRVTRVYTESGKKKKEAEWRAHASYGSVSRS